MEDIYETDEELLFLVENDENILTAEITDYQNKDKEMGAGIILTIGPSEEQIFSMIDKHGLERSEVNIKEYEILLTEGDLKKMLKIIKNYQN